MIDYNDYFTYNAETGELYWKPRTNNFAWSQKYAGTRAGYTWTGVHGNKYRYVNVNERHIRVHRIVWEMHFGPIPHAVQIDHVDLNGLNNRISNLRLASPTQNNLNCKVRKHSVSRMKGVRMDVRRGHWVSYVIVEGKMKHLGSFSTKGLAAVARAKAAIRYHGKFARFT